MHLKTRLLTHLCQRLEEILSIHVIDEDVLPAITSAHDVINRTRVLNSDLSRHRRSYPKFEENR